MFTLFHSIIFLIRKKCKSILLKLKLLWCYRAHSFNLFHFFYQLIDEYIEEDPSLTPWQLDWQRVLSTATEDMIMMADSVISLGAKVPHLSARASLDIGSVLRGIAKLHCTDRFDSWNISNVVSF